MTTSVRAFALLTVLALVGCPLPDGSSYGRPCSDDADCAAGYQCWADTCVPSSFGEPPAVDAGDPGKDAGVDAGGDDAGEPLPDGGVDAGLDGGGSVDDGGAGDDDAGEAGPSADAGAPIDAGDEDGGVDAGADAGEDAGPGADHWCLPGNAIDIDLAISTTYSGDNGLGASAFAGACTFDAVPEQVLRFTPPAPGTLHYELRSDLDLVVSFLDDCDTTVAQELKCIDRERPSRTEWGKIVLATTDPVYLVVDGFGEGDEGAWTLDLRFVEPACGNAHADVGETCDLDTVVSPWCLQCAMTSSPESEPNEDLLTADPISASYAWAQIDPIGDVDVFAFSVQDPNTSLTAEVTDTFDGTACNDPEVIDARVEIVDGAGAVLAVADGGRSTGCPVARALIATPATYFVRVRQSKNFATTPTLRFPYGLQVKGTVAACGNARLDVGEQCDDGDQLPGDGCDAACVLEAVTEQEPNHAEPVDTLAAPRNRGNDFTTTTVHGPITGDVVIDASLQPEGDEDVFFLLHEGTSETTVTARVLPPGGPYADCDVAALDVLLHVVDDQDQITETGDTPTGLACDEVTFALTPGVKTYLHIHDYGDDTEVPSYLLQVDFAE